MLLQHASMNPDVLFSFGSPVSVRRFDVGRSQGQLRRVGFDRLVGPGVPFPRCVVRTVEISEAAALHGVGKLVRGKVHTDGVENAWNPRRRGRAAG